MAARVAFSTRDPESAVPILEQYFADVRMRNPRGQRFSLDLAGATDEGIVHLDYRLASPDSASSVVTDREIVVGHVRRGRVALTGEREQHIDTALPWIFPRGRIEGRWDDVGMRVISFSPEVVERFVRAATGDDGVRFEFTPGVPTAEDARTWNALIAVTAAELHRDDAVSQSELARATRQTHLMMALVTTFPNTLTAGGRSRDRSGILPDAVRRALSFMEDNAHLPITIIDIAQAARLSVRGVQYGFRDHLGTTPLARLRLIRLHRVRQELLVADPTRGATVAEIARVWGFTHLGRFAEQYRTQFGESPRQTLIGG